MPWKGIRDPYKIWISEIILQQTRVEQGEKYYHAILEKYPTIRQLAEAPDNEVYTLWQGLGYYIRCRNMLFTARWIMTQHEGRFPDKYEDILKLKGIGNYTAAAISSFAYDLPHAVVDGNVVRILSRYFGLDTNFYSSAGKKEFEDLARRLLDKKKAALFNQSIMDLGAQVCKPRQPLCPECPLEATCKARIEDKTEIYPLKKVKIVLKKRTFHFFCFEYRDHLFIQKRTSNDIWHGLFSLYCVESEHIDLKKMDFLPAGSILSEPVVMTQKLTHQQIRGCFYTLKIKDISHLKLPSLVKVRKQDLKNYAFPRMIISFFQNKYYL